MCSSPRLTPSPKLTTEVDTYRVRGGKFDGYVVAYMQRKVTGATGSPKLEAIRAFMDKTGTISYDADARGDEMNLLQQAISAFIISERK